MNVRDWMNEISWTWSINDLCMDLWMDYISSDVQLVLFLDCGLDKFQIPIVNEYCFSI